MNYGFLFLGSVSMEDVARGIALQFGIAPDAIAVRDRATVVSPSRGLPVVLIEYDPDMNGEYVSFSAGPEFADAVGGKSETEVASILCMALSTRAILAAPDAASDAVWFLVVADGSSGLVLVDLDS